MARARKVNDGKESDSRRVNEGTGQEVSQPVEDEERDIARLMDQSVGRLYPREDLRSCVVCQKKDIKPEEFRAHVTTHKASYSGTPKGYYGCWSGGEFWFPLKFADGPCKWLCSVCGREKYYFGKDNTHGGPSTRLTDRRYALANCQGARYGDKAGHKRAFGKIDGQAGPVIFMHEGAPNPEQPEQTDKSVLEIINAKGVQGTAKKRKTNSKRTNRASRKV